MSAEERWVGVHDVAAHLGVAKDSVYRWIEERGLPAHRVGRLFRFKLSEIDEWVRQDNEGEKNRNSAQSRLSSKTQTNRSTPKARSRQRGGNA
jgi:excisionase family DNA binding protein